MNMAMSRGGVARLFCLALAAAAASAAQFRVGEQRGWSVPDGSAEPYNSWAGRMRFQIGDQLLFVYPKGSDSVLQVDAGAYGSCNTTSYVAKFEDGSTAVTLDRSGPFYFISGNEARCRASQKLQVVVLSSGHTPPPPAAVPPSPASPPSMPPPSPTGRADSPPAPGAMAPAPSSSSSSPGSPGGPTSPPGGSQGAGSTPGSGAASVAAGLLGALAAGAGYAVLAI